MATTAPVSLIVEIINAQLTSTWTLATATNTYTTDVGTPWTTNVYNDFTAKSTGAAGQTRIEMRYKVEITDVNAPSQLGVIAEPVTMVSGMLNNPTSAGDFESQVEAIINAAIVLAGYN